MEQINHRELISDLCEQISKDELLVQGAGGNVSWKEGDTLWVKASGTWLENAKKEDIFVPVSLNSINSEIINNNYAFKPKSENNSPLKPSIETILHALVKKKYVLHLHAVEVISDLIKDNCLNILNDIMPNGLAWKLIDYHTPGPDLAKSIKKITELNPDIKILFLKNHGLVISEDTVEDLKKLLFLVSKIFKKDIIYKENTNLQNKRDTISKDNITYKLIKDIGIQQLSLNKDLIKMIQNNWAICPDHIVFLGNMACIYDNLNIFKESENKKNDLIFIKNYGTYCTSNFNNSKKIQLKCYFNIICRLKKSEKIELLSENEIAKLLDWDAEKYRLSLMK